MLNFSVHVTDHFPGITIMTQLVFFICPASEEEGVV